MFEEDLSEKDEDPYFNAEEIAFKVRLQCHKDRKTIVKKMVKAGEYEDLDGKKLDSDSSPMKLDREKRERMRQNDKRPNGPRHSQLRVLNEAEEPEEEEDTYDEVRRHR